MLLMWTMSFDMMSVSFFACSCYQSSDKTMEKNKHTSIQNKEHQQSQWQLNPAETDSIQSAMVLQHPPGKSQADYLQGEKIPLLMSSNRLAESSLPTRCHKQCYVGQEAAALITVPAKAAATKGAIATAKASSMNSSILNVDALAVCFLRSS